MEATHRHIAKALGLSPRQAEDVPAAIATATPARLAVALQNLKARVLVRNTLAIRDSIRQIEQELASRQMSR